MTDVQTYGHPALQALNATFSKEQAQTLLALLAAVGGSDWDSIAGKPASFPPSAHTHTWGDVSGKPAQATRWPAWGEVTGKPSTFAPSSHTHTIANVDGLEARLSDIEGRLDALEEPEA